MILTHRMTASQPDHEISRLKGCRIRQDAAPNCLNMMR